MAIIPPQRKSISQVKAQLLNPATTSHFQVSVSFQKSGIRQYQQEIGLNLDQNRLNILCSEASLPGSRFLTAELNNNYNLGGEPSGHVIMSDHTKSGDGLLTAIKLISLLKNSSCKGNKEFVCDITSFFTKRR